MTSVTVKNCFWVCFFSEFSLFWCNKVIFCTDVQYSVLFLFNVLHRELECLMRVKLTIRFFFVAMFFFKSEYRCNAVFAVWVTSVRIKKMSRIKLNFEISVSVVSIDICYCEKIVSEFVSFSEFSLFLFFWCNKVIFCTDVRYSVLFLFDVLRRELNCCEGQTHNAIFVAM